MGLNLDLLIKLVRLANNNPNDNEANLAARKVCKMIGENNYKLDGTIKPTVKQQYNHQYYEQPKPHPFDDLFNRFYGQGPFRAGRNPFEESWVNTPPKSKVTPEEKEWENKNKGKWDIPNTGDFKKKERNPKIILKCSVCSIEKESRYVGNPTEFKCYDCHWKYYQQGNPK